MTAFISEKLSTIVYFALFAFLFLGSTINAEAQKRRLMSKVAIRPTTAKRAAPISAVVVDERLAVLRFEPSLASIPVQRMRVGRNVLIVGEKEIDGVRFYRAQLPPEKSGWVQAEAVISNGKRGDDERLARLIRASNGFNQLELAAVFVENFPASPLRPAVLLLFGDLIEENALRLTREASRKFDEEKIEASGAPLHTFYLNYAGLDRYRKLGINFIFDRERKQFGYDGAAWREILQKHSKSSEAVEAAKRVSSLTTAKSKGN